MGGGGALAGRGAAPGPVRDDAAARRPGPARPGHGRSSIRGACASYLPSPLRLAIFPRPLPVSRSRYGRGVFLKIFAEIS